MWRTLDTPRKDWQKIVTSQGLIFPETDRPDGTKTPYWNESAFYEFTMDEVLRLEAATEDLWRMSLAAVEKMLDLTDQRLGFPPGTLDLVRKSWARRDPTLYGRFDLRYDGDRISLMELNGDTPTGLVETGVAQWRWLEDNLPDTDQWNSVHERLVEGWQRLAKNGHLPGGAVTFLYSDVDTSGEEEMTVAYMMDTAVQAGLHAMSQPIEHVGYDTLNRRFVDVHGDPIRNAFKLYAWERMVIDEFGEALLTGAETTPVNWIEPAWKVLLSSKALLPVLWEMYPGHDLLLPAYFDDPHDLTDWIKKPLHGREGDNITVHRSDGSDDQVNPGDYGAEGCVYQEFVTLPTFGMDMEHHAMLGSWIVDGEAAGMIVRESDGPVTDYYSRVVPHIISDGLQPDTAQQDAWRRERATTST